MMKPTKKATSAATSKFIPVLSICLWQIITDMLQTAAPPISAIIIKLRCSQIGILKQSA